MLMIRFQRIGRRNDPAFRIIVTEKSWGPKAGRNVDLLGSYNPKTKAFSLDADRFRTWQAHGAQISPSLKNLLITQGIIKGKKVNVLPRKKPIKSEEQGAAESQSPAAEGETSTSESASSDSSETSEAPAPEEKGEEEKVDTQPAAPVAS